MQTFYKRGAKFVFDAAVHEKIGRLLNMDKRIVVGWLTKTTYLCVIITAGFDVHGNVINQFFFYQILKHVRIGSIGIKLGQETGIVNLAIHALKMRRIEKAAKKAEQNNQKTAENNKEAEKTTGG